MQRSARTIRIAARNLRRVRAVSLRIIDDLGMRKLPHTASVGLAQSHHGTLRTHEHDHDVEQVSRRLGQVARPPLASAHALKCGP